jgi:hypothetical protein
MVGGLPPWLRRGKLDRVTGVLIGSSVVVSAVALAAWFGLTKPDYRALRGSLIPDLPLPLLVVGIVLFAIANAAVEEFVYRGAVMGALEAVLGNRVGPGLSDVEGFSAPSLLTATSRPAVA